MNSVINLTNIQVGGFYCHTIKEVRMDGFLIGSQVHKQSTGTPSLHRQKKIIRYLLHRNLMRTSCSFYVVSNTCTIIHDPPPRTAKRKCIHAVNLIYLERQQIFCYYVIHKVIQLCIYVYFSHDKKILTSQYIRQEVYFSTMRKIYM